MTHARLCLAATLVAMLVCGAALAEARPASCARLVALVQEFTGYEVTASLMREDAGGCVMEPARLVTSRPDWPDLTATTLRLTGEVDANAVTSVGVDMAGLKLGTGLGDKPVDERLHAMFRLQKADLRLRAALIAGTARLEIRSLDLRLSGGTEIRLAADVAATGLSPLELVAGRLTMLDLIWKTDGQLPGRIMELAGSRLEKGLAGGQAIQVAQDRLTTLLAALPETMFLAESRAGLDRFLADLPLGRGELRLTLAGDPGGGPGIGAANLLLAAASKDPMAPETLAIVFEGMTLTADWQQGLQP